MQKIIVVLVLAAIALGAAVSLGAFGTDGTHEAREYRDEMFVLQYDAASADECDAGDTFDAETGVCEYECTDEAECDALAAEAENELAAWGDAIEQDTTPVHEERASEDVLAATYAVRASEQLVHADGTDAPAYREIWEQVAALSPNTFSDTYIETYGVFDDERSDTLAYVSDDDGNGKWLIVVNVAGYQSSSERERASTLIHELGHIVTLNESQVADADESACEVQGGFYTGEGCAAKGTYINDFVRRFWPLADLAAVGGGAGENETDLYARAPERFVSDYAATNPGEDIAESFALFILDSKPRATDTVAREKVAFFYAYPELAAFRTEMRSALVTAHVRAKRAAR